MSASNPRLTRPAPGCFPARAVPFRAVPLLWIGLLTGCGSSGGVGSVDAGGGSPVPDLGAAEVALPDPGTYGQGDAQDPLGTVPGSSSDAEVPTADGACAAQSASTQLMPIALAVLLDRSGSMGKLDKPEHDPEKRWIPVTNALKSFFADSKSTGMSASLQLFPSEDDKCKVASYLEPVLPMTPLPEPSKFADAIDDNAKFIGDTPTSAAYEGTYRYALSVRKDRPDTQVAIVIVTDGVPNGCDEDTAQENLLGTITSAHDEGILTFVLGVGEFDGLQDMARDGGTEAPYMISVGDPAKTQAELSAAIDKIRGNVQTCKLSIPPPPSGQTLDPDFVNVRYEAAPGSSERIYRTDQSCKDPAGWRYDDAKAPKAIELCDRACAKVQGGGAAGKVFAEFGCRSEVVLQ